MGSNGFIDCFFDWLDGKDVDPVDCLLDHGFEPHPDKENEDDSDHEEDND